MNRITSDNILLGEAGDVVIKRQYYNDHIIDRLVGDGYYLEHLSQIQSEDAGNGYIRLIGLPRIKDITSIYPLILLTHDGAVMIIAESQVRYLELDLPPIKKLYDTKPFAVLDVTNILTFLNINQIVARQFPNYPRIRKNNPFANLGSHRPRDMAKYEAPGYTTYGLDNSGWGYQSLSRRGGELPGMMNMADAMGRMNRDELMDYANQLANRVEEYNITDSITNIMGIIYNGELFESDSEHYMVIITDQNQVISGKTSDIASGNYKIQDSDDQLEMIRSQFIVAREIIVDQTIVQNVVINNHQAYLSNIGYLDYYVDDIISDQNGNIYILSGDIIRISSNRRLYNTKILEIGFRPIRFVEIGNLDLVEDSGGNLYSLPDLTLVNYPIRLSNYDPYSRVGINTKSSRKP